MKKQSRLLSKIPAILSSRISIYIYLFLFIYLVIFALLCAVIPVLGAYAPSDTIQLIMGNYTNVLSALGASLAAGSGVAVHAGIREIHKRHDKLEATIAALHQKIDRLESAATEKKPSAGQGGA